MSGQRDKSENESRKAGFQELHLLHRIASCPNDLPYCDYFPRWPHAGLNNPKSTTGGPAWPNGLENPENETPDEPREMIKVDVVAGGEPWLANKLRKISEKEVDGDGRIGPKLSIIQGGKYAGS